jgi:tRNA-binding EMAP/Myf-like protein
MYPSDCFRNVLTVTEQNKKGISWEEFKMQNAKVKMKNGEPSEGMILSAKGKRP